MLDNIIRGEIDTSEETRQAFSKDASMYRVLPDSVMSPLDVADISALVHYATENRKQGNQVSITPRNGGSCMSGGSLTEGIVLDMSRHMNQLGAVDSHDKTITVQAGCMHKAVERAAKDHGLLFAPYTSSKDICGIGGMIGNNASGEMSLRHGPTSHNVTSLDVVLSDGNEYSFQSLTRKEVQAKLAQPSYEGEVYRQVTKLLSDNKHLIDVKHPRVTKNAAGYPLWELWDSNESHFNLGRLFIGSQATLGIVTHATLQLIDAPTHEQMIVCAINSIRDLTEVVQAIVRNGAIICETFDLHTYALAQEQYPHDAANASFANGKHMVVYGIFAGDTKQAAEVYAGAAKNFIETDLHQAVYWVDDEAVKASYQAIRRYSFKMLNEMDSSHYKAVPFIEDTIVPLMHYGEFVGALEAILQDFNMTYTYAGHIGEGSIRLIPLVQRASKTAVDDILNLLARVNDLVLAFGGSISVDHNDGIVRTPYLEQQYGPEMYALFKQIKTIFDPLGIFNPGKKIGGTIEYASKHIDLS